MSSWLCCWKCLINFLTILTVKFWNLMPQSSLLFGSTCSHIVNSHTHTIIYTFLIHKYLLNFNKSTHACYLPVLLVQLGKAPAPVRSNFWHFACPLLHFPPVFFRMKRTYRASRQCTVLHIGFERHPLRFLASIYSTKIQGVFGERAPWGRISVWLLIARACSSFSRVHEPSAFLFTGENILHRLLLSLNKGKRMYSRFVHSPRSP